MSRDATLAEVGHASERLVVLNRHDPREDGNRDSCTHAASAPRPPVRERRRERTSSSTGAVPLHEDVDVVKELRDDKVCASLLLLEEVLDVGQLVVRISMSLGVSFEQEIASATASHLRTAASRTRHTDTERVPVVLPDVLD